MTSAPEVQPADVRLVLDLRAFSHPSNDRDALGKLWPQLEHALAQLDLVPDGAYTIDSGGHGTIGIRVIEVADGHRRSTPRTRFAVHHVMARPTVRLPCSTCRDDGRRTYGPYTCASCPPPGKRDDKRPGRVCEDHVVVLSGSLLSMCRRHADSCSDSSCNRPATYRCEGSGCRRRTPWCDDHRRSAPGDPASAYCPACQARDYPSCSRPGCGGIGSIRCELVVDRDGRACDIATCGRHAARWQVYGPHVVGIGLCPPHRETPRTLDAQQVVYQIVAVASTRAGPLDVRVRRTSLGSVRHTFVKLHDAEPPSIPELDRMFVRLASSLSPEIPHEDKMKQFVGRHAQVRENAVSVAAREQEEGYQRLRQLQAVLQREGKGELAAAMTYADWRPRAGAHGRLFVKLPEEYRGLFIGARGQNVQRLGMVLGFDVGLERGQGRGGR
jgi:hypothetical protein